MSEINASNFKKEHGDLAPDLVGVTELTSPIYFVPPSGTTEERPSDCEPGTLRFNTDIGTLEVFRGDKIGWEQIQRREDQYLGGSNAAQAGSNKGTGVRGLFALGGHPSTTNKIDFVTVSTLGDAKDFGDLSSTSKSLAIASSSTRGIFKLGSSGNGPAESNVYEFVAFSSKGDRYDFGDSTTNARQFGGMSDSTRGVFAGGYKEPGPSPYFIDRIEYITMASEGDAKDFGNLSAVQGARVPATASSTTRGVYHVHRPNSNILEHVTISTLGNANDFGDLTVAVDFPTAFSNSTRGLFAGGAIAGDTAKNDIGFITISTLGNALDFGDLLAARIRFVGATSSPTRGIFAGGLAPSVDNVMQYVQIATTGDAFDFGDLTAASSFGSSGGPSSHGHGGL